MGKQRFLLPFRVPKKVWLPEYRQDLHGLKASLVVALKKKHPQANNNFLWKIQCKHYINSNMFIWLCCKYSIQLKRSIFRGHITNNKSYFIPQLKKSNIMIFFVLFSFKKS
jgi:hypothetical protein